jgi:hypothetical protein
MRVRCSSNGPGTDCNTGYSGPTPRRLLLVDELTPGPHGRRLVSASLESLNFARMVPRPPKTLRPPHSPFHKKAPARANGGALRASNWTRLAYSAGSVISALVPASWDLDFRGFAFMDWEGLAAESALRSVNCPRSTFWNRASAPFLSISRRIAAYSVAAGDRNDPSKPSPEPTRRGRRIESPCRSSRGEQFLRVTGPLLCDPSGDPVQLGERFAAVLRARFDRADAL